MRRLFLWPLAVLLTACAYLGKARDFDPKELEAEGWIGPRGVPLVLQGEAEDCGAAALAMVLRYWGLSLTLEQIKEACPPAPTRGIKAGELRGFARSRGLHAFLLRGRMEDLQNELSRRRPVIVGMVKPFVVGPLMHYEVVVALHPERRIVVTLDPARGWRQNSYEGFAEEWGPSEELALIVFKSEVERKKP